MVNQYPLGYRPDLSKAWHDQCHASPTQESPGWSCSPCSYTTITQKPKVRQTNIQQHVSSAEHKLMYATGHGALQLSHNDLERPSLERPDLGNDNIIVQDHATHIFSSINNHILNEITAANSRQTTQTTPYEREKDLVRKWDWWARLTHGICTSLATEKRFPTTDELTAFEIAWEQSNPEPQGSWKIHNRPVSRLPLLGPQGEIEAIQRESLQRFMRTAVEDYKGPSLQSVRVAEEARIRAMQVAGKRKYDWMLGGSAPAAAASTAGSDARASSAGQATGPTQGANASTTSVQSSQSALEASGVGILSEADLQGLSIGQQASVFYIVATWCHYKADYRYRQKYEVTPTAKTTPTAKATLRNLSSWTGKRPGSAT